MTLGLETTDGVELNAFSGNGEYALYVPRVNGGGWQEGCEWSVGDYASVLHTVWTQFVEEGTQPELLGHPLTLDGLVDATCHFRGTSFFAQDEFMKLKYFILTNSDGIRDTLGAESFDRLVRDLNHADY